MVIIPDGGFIIIDGGEDIIGMEIDGDGTTITLGIMVGIHTTMHPTSEEV